MRRRKATRSAASPADSGADTPRIPPWHAQLAGALACEAEQLLRACAIGKLRLPLQLREQRNRLRIVARRQRGPRVGQGLLEDFRWQGRITADALDRYRCHLRHGGVQVAGDGVIPMASQARG